jgi:hypothetical protein
LQKATCDLLWVWFSLGKNQHFAPRSAIQEFIPPQPPNSFRVVLELNKSEKRLDAILLAALKKQNTNLNLREISRGKFKELFRTGKIMIKGQRATPTSAIAKGTTYVDILGFESK